MYNYTDTKDYKSLDYLLIEIYDTLSKHKYDSYFQIDVIVTGKFIQNILLYFMNYDYSIQYLKYNNFDYDKEYIFNITNENKLYLQPMWLNDDVGYVNPESDICYMYEDINYKILDKVYCKNKIIFGFYN